MIKLRYGNTNTFYIPGNDGGIRIDTDYAGTIQGFFRAIKAAGIGTGDIRYLIATHFHPDHIGIAGELQELGITPAVIDVQMPHIHFSDHIFAREKHPGHKMIDENAVKVISITGSRAFLEDLGIAGEIVHTPSHSEDSISVLLDDGDCFVGDLERREYLDSYGENAPLKADWDHILSYEPKRVFFAHSPEYILR